MRQSELGEILKQEGMADSIEAADRRISNWAVSAFNILKSFLRSHKGEFMAEDIREYAKECKLEDPPSNRAWGSLIVKAKKQELIEFVKYDQVKNPKAHRANAVVWRAK